MKEIGFRKQDLMPEAFDEGVSPKLMRCNTGLDGEPSKVVRCGERKSGCWEGL